MNHKDIKNLFEKVLENQNWQNKLVIDFPAGSGHTSNSLIEKGAQVAAFDAFPEFFKGESIKCGFGDLQKNFPSKDNYYDVAICQEGIEHVPNQLFVFQEFHRILKNQGQFFLTTPNYSNYRSRLSYLMFESETPKMLPPNEIESVWFGQSDSRLYFGHIFSVGIMRLRCMAYLSGFELVQIHKAAINWSSVIFGIILFPLTLIITFRNNLS